MKLKTKKEMARQGNCALHLVIEPDSWGTLNKQSHCTKTTHYRVIQSLGPPYWAKLAIAYEKLRIAFSNTTYLKIIWRVWCLFGYLVTHFGSKRKNVHFGLVFPLFSAKNAPEIDQIMMSRKNFVFDSKLSIKVVK